METIVKRVVTESYDNGPDLPENSEIRNITHEEDPETDVQEYDELLPDGTVVKRKTIRTKTTVVHELMQEGGETIPTSDHEEPKKNTVPTVSDIEMKYVNEGDIESRSETQATEDRKDDGTCIKKTVITTSHFKPVERVLVSNGVERVEHSEKPVGTEIDENILELGPGVESPDSDNVEKKTSVREREETTGEGTWIKHKTTTVTVTSLSTTEAPPEQLMPSGEGTEDVLEDAITQESAVVDQSAPVMKPPEVKEGDIESRCEAQVMEDRKDDGTYIKKTIITTSHFKPVEIVVVSDGLERVEHSEKPVGTEIDENILELGPGVESPDSDNVEKKTSVREREETTGEGTWIKHKTTTVTVTSLSTTEAPPEQLMPSGEGTEDVLEDAITQESAVVDQSAPVMKPPEVKEGDIESRCETQVMEDRKDDGTYIKKTIITTSHFKPVEIVVVSDGLERVEHSEKIVGTEIDENVLELGPAVESPESDNVEKKTSVREREETTSEGTWIKHKTTTVTVTSLRTTEAPSDELIPSDQATDILEDAVAQESVMVDQAAPVMKPPEVKEWDIENRSETQVVEDRKDDGTYIKMTIITTSHFKPIETIVTADGVERVEKTELPIGTEIDENVLELGPGVESPDSDNVEKKTSVRERDETTSEGTWIKHKTTTVTVTSLSTTEAPSDQLIPSDQATDVLDDAVAKESDMVDQAAPVMKPPEVKDGDVESRSETQVMEDRKDDGTYIKKTVLTTSHFKPIETIVTADGVETVEKTELPIGTEIDENILELGPGVESPDSDNVEKKTSVRERDETTSEGTWIKHKTTTMTVTSLSTTEAPSDQATDVLDHAVAQESARIDQASPVMKPPEVRKEGDIES